MILALQLSGLEGQRFAFHGYLPREEDQLKLALLSLEKRSRQDKATQLWIEAPYRSAKLAKLALETLTPTTQFCIALNLTTSRERHATRQISAWKKAPWQIEKEPAVFLLYA
jgi:16S rRNA (cytidine1402-2'-O)-methyltransferase